LEKCKSLNFKLAEFETKEEQDAVLGMFKSIVTDSEHFFIAIGGKRKASDNTKFYWVDSVKTVDYALDWCPGEPNNHQQREKCLSLMGRDDNRFKYGLNDHNCEKTGKYICEDDAKTSSGILKNTFSFKDINIPTIYLILFAVSISVVFVSFIYFIRMKINN
jgi:hypothetical protein